MAKVTKWQAFHCSNKSAKPTQKKPTSSKISFWTGSPLPWLAPRGSGRHAEAARLWCWAGWHCPHPAHGQVLDHHHHHHHHLDAQEGPLADELRAAVWPTLDRGAGGARQTLVTLRIRWWSSINAMMMVNLIVILICWWRELLLQLSIIMVQRWNPSSNSNLIPTCTWSRSWFQSRCNLFETGSASEWTLYISEWTSPPGGGLPLSNIRITTKVSFRRHNHQQHLK